MKEDTSFQYKKNKGELKEIKNAMQEKVQSQASVKVWEYVWEMGQQDIFQHYAYGYKPIHCFENQEQIASLVFLLKIKLLLRMSDSHNLFPEACIDKNSKF